MTTNTIVEAIKNTLAPEVKVERVITFKAAKNSWFELMDGLSAAFQLEFLQQDGATYRFKFPGNAVVACSQVKVTWGATPDVAPYRRLQAYLELRRIDDQTIQLKLFENMMGTAAEQAVYHQVLVQRMEKIMAYLEGEG